MKIHPQLQQTLPLSRSNGRPTQPLDGYVPGELQPLQSTLSLLERRPAGEKLFGALRSRIDSLAFVGKLAGLLTVPAMGGLLARFLGQAERVPDWVQNHAPGKLQQALKAVLKRGNDPLQKSLGLSVLDLLKAERELYQRLAPQRSAQGVEAAPWLRNVLGFTPTSVNSKAAPLVDLGPERQAQAQEISRRFATLAGPPADAPAELMPVWNSLFEKAEKGHWPVFIDLDGDLTQTTATEAIANEAAASLMDRKNRRGTLGGATPKAFYGWLQARLESHCNYFEPWLKQQRPRVYECVRDIKQDLNPAWLDAGSEAALGWRLSPEVARRAGERLLALAQTTYAGSFADALVSLDADLVTGVQSYWIKLLRESSPESRRQLLGEVAKAWALLSTQRPSGQNPLRAMQQEDASLQMPHFDPLRGQWKNRAYEAGAALAEVVDHTLNGLGIAERREFLQTLRGALKASQPELEQREQSLRHQYGSAYQGLDVATLLAGKASDRELEVATSLLQLETLEEQLIQVPSKDWGQRRGELQKHRAIMGWLAGLDERYGEMDIIRPPGSSGSVGVSEFFPETQVRPSAAPAELRPQVLGKASNRSPQKLSIVLEGGGGKGFCYPECLEQLKQSLAQREGQVVLEEFVGTSAGAITAGLLAAGFEGEELRSVMERMDFKKFNSDFLWLQGGHDPTVRGIDRTGMFSMQEMYRTLHGLLGQKLGIAGRPITFQDLPSNLKVMGTVLNTDLPAQHPLREHIGADGQIEFSRQTTPHFDVVGCILASAAVPLFFNAPQLHIADEHGQRYRMQLVDGGVVNNLAISRAGDPEEKSALVMLPAYYEVDGENRLTTLSFESTGPQIDAKNRYHYGHFTPQLGAFLDRLQEENYERAVVAFNLTDEAEQPRPLVQGRTRQQSQQLVKMAEQVWLPVLSPDEADRVVRSNLPQSDWKSRLSQFAADLALDGADRENYLRPSLLGSPNYRPDTREASSLWQVLSAVVAASQASRGQGQTKLFEQK